MLKVQGMARAYAGNSVGFRAWFRKQKTLDEKVKRDFRVSKRGDEEGAKRPPRT